jgi:small conductance mechanosensitive channel
MDQEIQELQRIYQLVIDFFVNYSFQLLGALLIILLGIWLGHRASRLVLNLCAKKSVDITFSRFLANVVKILVIFMMVIVALGKVGISIGPFVAALGAISLGAGLALQSPLANYGAGLNLVLTRPFVVGDTISVQNITGIVEEIRLACTILNNEDGVKITIPNRHIIGEIIHNSNSNSLIETQVGIGHDSDPELAISLISKALDDAGLSNKDMPAQIGIDAFGDSNILLAVRLWAATDKHFQIRYQVNNLIYQTLKDAGIKIAYPHREIKLLKQAN